ncbi:MAG: glucosaminidase domain-containing protein [Bacteroidales bacterium]|nr:glucosaminidase domain-containing protein [Bacteroidales bacterium]
MSFLNKFILSVIYLFFIFTSSYAQKMSRAEYISRYKDIAIEQMKSHAIPASIILAQATLESGDGNSTLAKEANNHFGIKCHNWKGDTFLHTDDSVNECFRKYKNPEESFRDHSDFLRYRERYRSLFDLDPTDYKAWAYGLKKAGYATNPNYAQLLIKIIEDHSLFKYDLLRTLLPPSPTVIIDEKIITPERVRSEYRFTLSRVLLSKNGVLFIVAGLGESYSSIAAEFNLFTKELLKFNDLKKEIPVKDGTTVYIERKRREGDKNLSKHIVEKGESMYEISQMYAIRLDKLYKINEVKKGYEPNEGDEVKLR